MDGYYLYLLFLEKHVVECKIKDLLDLEKISRRMGELIEKKANIGIRSRYHKTGVIVILQKDEDPMQNYLCMNHIEEAAGNLLTNEYQISFIYSDYAVPADHVDMMIESGCLQYEHSYIASNSRRTLEVGMQSMGQHGRSELQESLRQLQQHLQRGDYEQARLDFSYIESLYQSDSIPNPQRMQYRIGMMDLLFSNHMYEEKESDRLGQLLFEMLMNRTWHHFMLSEIYRICQRRNGNMEAGFNMNFLQRVRHYIDREIHNPDLNLKMASDAFGLTPSYFSSVFKKNMQMNFLTYVENKRMNIGYALLRHGDITVEKAAHACGYESVSSFRRNFKKFFGKNPVDVLNGE